MKGRGADVWVEVVGQTGAGGLREAGSQCRALSRSGPQSNMMPLDTGLRPGPGEVRIEAGKSVKRLHSNPGERWTPPAGRWQRGWREKSYNLTISSA